MIVVNPGLGAGRRALGVWAPAWEGSAPAAQAESCGSGKWGAGWGEPRRPALHKGRPSQLPGTCDLDQAPSPETCLQLSRRHRVRSPVSGCVSRGGSVLRASFPLPWMAAFTPPTHSGTERLGVYFVDAK